MNFFTPDDFKSSDGEYASPEAAARIANEKLKIWQKQIADLFTPAFAKECGEKMDELTRDKNDR